jgi:hypothetical protein
VASELDRLVREQAGVVSRRQALGCGLADNDIRRLVRRREWATVHQGVYADHNGPLTWMQRAWAAVLWSWPAALSHDSALRAADGPGRRERTDREPIHVAVSRERKLAAPAGVVVHRLAGLAERTLWNTSPPRMRIEEAVIDLAGGSSTELRSIAMLADAVQSRRTTAPRLLAVLDARAWVRRRELMSGVLADISAGTCSVLEHSYLARVERPHGLPRPKRQARPVGQQVLRDIDFDEYALVIELDGRLFHDTAWARDADLERDLDARLLDGRETVRLGWGQVFDRPCATAAKVGMLLQHRGWTGSPRRCPCPACDS